MQQRINWQPREWEQKVHCINCVWFKCIENGQHHVLCSFEKPGFCLTLASVGAHRIRLYFFPLLFLIEMCVHEKRKTATQCWQLSFRSLDVVAGRTNDGQSNDSNKKNVMPNGWTALFRPFERYLWHLISILLHFRFDPSYNYKAMKFAFEQWNCEFIWSSGLQ